MEVLSAVRVDLSSEFYKIRAPSTTNLNRSPAKKGDLSQDESKTSKPAEITPKIQKKEEAEMGKALLQHQSNKEQAIPVAKSVFQLNSDLAKKQREAEKKKLNDEIIDKKNYLSQLKDIREKKENVINQDF